MAYINANKTKPGNSPFSLEQLSDLDNWELPEHIVEQSNGKFETGQLAWLMRNRDTNGLGQFVKKIGKRLYIFRPGLGYLVATTDNF